MTIERIDAKGPPVNLVLEPGTQLFIDDTQENGFWRVIVYHDEDEFYWANLAGVRELLGREVPECHVYEGRTLTAGPSPHLEAAKAKAEEATGPVVDDLFGLDRKALLALRRRINDRLFDLEQDKHAAVVADMNMPQGWGDDATDATDGTDGDNDG